MGGNAGEKPCTPAAAIIFVVGLLAGTGCIIVRAIHGSPQRARPPSAWRAQHAAFRVFRAHSMLPPRRGG
jgi:hypothetical protein